MAGMLGVEVDISGEGDHVVAAGSPGESIKVWRIVLTCQKEGEEPVAVRLKSGSKPLPGPLSLLNGGSIALGFDKRRWAMTEPGEDLIINMSVDASLTGSLSLERGVW